jgi:DNA helicase-2/ATP-dependent DNA helicase PcrA
MRERITHLIGPSAEGLRWLGTFHSVSAQSFAATPNWWG